MKNAHVRSSVHLFNLYIFDSLLCCPTVFLGTLSTFIFCINKIDLERLGFSDSCWFGRRVPCSLPVGMAFDDSLDIAWKILAGVHWEEESGVFEWFYWWIFFISSLIFFGWMMWVGYIYIYIYICLYCVQLIEFYIFGRETCITPVKFTSTLIINIVLLQIQRLEGWGCW